MCLIAKCSPRCSGSLGYGGACTQCTLQLALERSRRTAGGVARAVREVVSDTGLAHLAVVALVLPVLPHVGPLLLQEAHAFGLL